MPIANIKNMITTMTMAMITVFTILMPAGKKTS